MIRNLPIRSKLIGMLIGPLLALTLLTSLGIGTNLATKVQAEHLRQEAAFATTSSRLVHELQDERDLAAGWVSGGRVYDGRRRDLDDQQAHVNRALEAARKDGQALEEKSSSFYGTVQTALAGLGRLADVRGRVAHNPTYDISAQQVLDSYSELIGDLLAVDFEIARDADIHTMTRNVAAFVAMARLGEAASQERGLLHAVTVAGKFAPGQPQRVSALVGAQESWRSQFNAAATPQQHQALDRTLQRADSEQATQLRDDLVGSGPSQPTTAPSRPTTVRPADWYRAATARIELLRGIEEDLAGDVDAAAAAVQAGGSRRALIYTVILTALLWLTVALVLLMASSMVRPLRTLTDTANEVADHRLPGLVDQLQHAEDPRDLDVVPEPIPVTSKDEIGQVSAAFNSVHSTAIRVATEQAALRRSVGDMFLNLARRSQSLIDRQLELMDDLERNETDPDTLENLFKLDHLATRMRRNSEDLIVLSGEAPPRRWSQPMPLVEVVRAAVAEVEDYNRVELLPIDETIGLAGQAVADVVHLLAELIENATSFSPPTTKVQVAGQSITSGYVLEIEDRGLGMSDEELVDANQRLANPPIVDFALSRMLGLYVVARLAQRYNIKVQLRHSWYGGITALVLLPPSVTVRPPQPEALEAARNGRQWPQLTPPARLGPVGGATWPGAPPTGPPFPAPDGGEGQSGDHLPIFEAARSDWFDGGEVHRDHLPLRPHGAEQQPRMARQEPWWGAGAGPEQPPVGAAVPLQQPPPTPTPPPPPAPTPPAPPAAAQPLRAEPSSAPASSPPPAAPAPPVTAAGLPRRVPRANLAPGILAMQADQAEQEPPPASPEPPPAPTTADAPTARVRSPEQVRSMLSSYRSGVERGRTRAGGPDPDALRSPGSDDDPPQ
jgi:HAMP domain-containing protein